MMVVVAIVATLLYDLYANVYPRRPVRRAPAAPVDHVTLASAMQAPSASAPAAVPSAIASDATAMAVGWSDGPMTAGLARISVPLTSAARLWTVPPGSSVTWVGEADPIRELAQRIAAVRLLGLGHVREAHPLFRTGTPTLTQPSDESVAPLLISPAGATRSTAARRRARRLAPEALAAARATGRLRLVTDADRPPSRS